MKKISLFALAALTGITGFAAVKTTVNKVNADEDQVIKAFADYRFQDADNLGKDTSGNGFDLSKVVTSVSEHAIEQLEDEQGKYLSIVRDEDEEGVPNGGGAYLYAPQLGTTGKDWSDLIQGNYTVTLTVKSDTNYGRGDRYSLSFGRYQSAPCFAAWRGGWECAVTNSDFFVQEDHPGVEKQAYLEENTPQINYTGVGDEWINITLVGNADEGKMYFYVNGTLANTVEPDGGVRLTNLNTADEQAAYTFCIGAQCDTNGSSLAQLSTCCYRRVTTWDCALSADNVARVVAGGDPVLADQEEGNNSIVTGIELPDLSDVDLDVTDANKLSAIVKNQLSSKKIKVTTNDGGTHAYTTVWYPTTDGKTIKGKAIVPAINLDNLQGSVEYSYACKIDVDPDAVEITNVLLDGEEFEFGDKVDEKRHSLEFNIVAKKGVTIKSVIYNEMEFDPEDEDEGYYFIMFSKGALIIVETEGTPEGKETSSSADTPATSESTTVTSSEAATSEATSEPTSTGGCGSSIAAGSLIVSLIAVAGVCLLRKKEN